MTAYRVAVVAGDGVGQEVIPEGIKVLDAVKHVRPQLEIVFSYFDWGTEYYLKTGRMMPEDGLQVLREFDAVYFGAVGDPRVPNHITAGGLLLAMRRFFDQCVMIRPAYLYPGVRTPLRGKNPGEIDLMVVRQNTEGEYTDAGGRLYPGTDDEVAIQTAIFTRRGTEVAIRYAFQLAHTRGKRRKVTSITKSNAQRYGMLMWDEVFSDVRQAFPDVEAETRLVDAAALDLVLRPEAFDVIVASNLFGDILGDLAAGLVGSIGLAPSASLDPSRRYPSTFEPAHGSAPDIAGRGIANPIGAILAGAFMLEFLGEADAADSIRAVVARVLAEGVVRTPDLGGNGTTTEVGDVVAERLVRTGV